MSDLLIKKIPAASDRQFDKLNAGRSKIAWLRSWLAAVLWLVWRSVRLAFRTLVFPYLFVRLLRRNMTVSSVSVLLIGIMTLNIIWGYPWTGMFAACISLLFIGMLVNYWMRPQLRIGFSLPPYTPAQQPCCVVAHCTNTRRVPAFDFSVALKSKTPRSNRKSAPHVTTTKNAANFFAIAGPGDGFDVSATVTFPVRGIHPLPAVTVVSAFPFQLFRNTQEIASSTTIAVTPRPLSGDEDATARALMSAVGGWSHRLASGDALDYTGSREYQPGMPVRRWDFVSWARLGRPIVREFQSPSVQAALLIVDTSVSDDQDVDRGKQLMERALSLAASAIGDLTAKSIRVQLYVTSEIPDEQIGMAKVRASAADAESMLIRLAKAEETLAPVADERIREVMMEGVSCPTLLITSRPSSEAFDDLAGRVNLICVNQQQGTENDSSAIRSDNGRKRHDSAHDATDRTADTPSPVRLPSREVAIHE